MSCPRARQTVVLSEQALQRCYVAGLDGSRQREGHWVIMSQWAACLVRAQLHPCAPFSQPQGLATVRQAILTTTPESSKLTPWHSRRERPRTPAAVTLRSACVVW